MSASWLIRATLDNVVRIKPGAYRPDSDVGGPPGVISQDPTPVAEQRRARGLVDTSVVIDVDVIDPHQLPRELAVTAVPLAELAVGPHAPRDVRERARRQDRLQRSEATFDPLPVDSDVARAYERSWRRVARRADGW